MSAIGPGDFVECVDVSARQPNPYNDSLVRLRVGALYRVHDGFINPRGIPCVVLREVYSSHPSRAFRADRFRPIYRPKQSLIRDLLEPIKEDA